MTALTKYQRLECSGLWRAGPDSQRREVIVCFGNASLVISDTRSGTPLTHWSLPAVKRIGTSPPAVYAPGTDAHEVLEIEDETMIAAIEKVRSVIAARRRSDGRLRRSISWAVAGATALGLAIWLPGALVRQTAAVLPAAKRAEIGGAILADMLRIHGAPCSDPLGRRALDRLQTRVLGQSAGGNEAQVLILRDGPQPAAHLPGARVLLSRVLVEKADGPALAAGYILAERVAAAQNDPILPVLEYAGVIATFRLLTTGRLPDSALDGYAARLITNGETPPPYAALLERMASAAVPAAPYAYALDPSGETTLPLIEGDPFRSKPAPMLLSDGDWVSLQGICNR